MIIQFLMDLLRDQIVNWLAGISIFWSAASVDAVLASIGSPSSVVGKGLAVLFTASGWGVVFTLLVSYLVFWAVTLPIRMIFDRLG